MSVIREICDHVLVLDQGEIAETGRVWEVFGRPTHEATRALLAPLDRGLPEDLAARLQPQWDGRPARALIEFVYTGAADRRPDVSGLSALLGANTLIVQSQLDRIDGHLAGRLILSTPAGDRLDTLIAGQDLAHAARILGYVPADD